MLVKKSGRHEQKSTWEFAMFRTALVVVALALAAPAWPCDIAGPIPTPQRLVRGAEVIARVRAQRPAGSAETERYTRSSVPFSVLEVLKGQVPDSKIVLSGSLTDRDDPNDRAVPYKFIRPEGRRGNCFATSYREGAEYLLLLHRGGALLPGDPGELTPYWSPLAPTNEQLFGGDQDPWLVWVKRQLR